MSSHNLTSPHLVLTGNLLRNLWDPPAKARFSNLGTAILLDPIILIRKLPFYPTGQVLKGVATVSEAAPVEFPSTARALEAVIILNRLIAQIQIH